MNWKNWWPESYIKPYDRPKIPEKVRLYQIGIENHIGLSVMNNDIAINECEFVNRIRNSDLKGTYHTLYIHIIWSICSVLP